MPMQNTLNVSELLKRLGVSGDSMGSAPLLDAMRLSINLADLSDLVPPVAVPIGGASQIATSPGGTVNKWTLQCASPGGLMVGELMTSGTFDFFVWQSAADPFAGSVESVHAELAFGQVTQSRFFNAPAAAPVAPANVFRVRISHNATVLLFGNWLGPGQFFNFEAIAQGVGNQLLSLTWREFPGAINP